jgi:hypothetical protein
MQTTNPQQSVCKLVSFKKHLDKKHNLRAYPSLSNFGL